MTTNSKLHESQTVGVQGSCMYPFHSTRWGANWLTPICCGGMIFPLKPGKLRVLIDTVGVPQRFIEDDFLGYSQYMLIMPDLRYQIDISGFVSYPDLNISQIFDPPIYGYIVKIFNV